RSFDGGANWLPYTTGMPVVAVFDISIQEWNRILRCATHGRGIWERLLDTATPALASLVGSEGKDGHVVLSWYKGGGGIGAVNLYRRYVPGEWEKIATLTTDGSGRISYEDKDVLSTGTYDYRLGFASNGQEVFAGEVRVDLGQASRLSLAGMYPNPTTSGMMVNFSLPNSAPASIDVVDATGRTVFTRPVGTMGAGKHQLDLRAQKFTPGAYCVR